MTVDIILLFPRQREANELAISEPFVRPISENSTHRTYLLQFIAVVPLHQKRREKSYLLILWLRIIFSYLRRKYRIYPTLLILIDQLSHPSDMIHGEIGKETLPDVFPQLAHFVIPPHILPTLNLLSRLPKATPSSFFSASAIIR